MLGFSLVSDERNARNFGMPQKLLAWANLAADEDFCAVLFLSLSGLDLSFWLVSRGFLLAM
jgi:hypothetical protein